MGPGFGNKSLLGTCLRRYYGNHLYRTYCTIFTDIQQEPKKPKNPLYRNLEDWRAKILKELIHGLGRR